VLEGDDEIEKTWRTSRPGRSCTTPSGSSRRATAGSRNCAIRDLSYYEIADTPDITADNAGVRIDQALSRLRAVVPFTGAGIRLLPPGSLVAGRELTNRRARDSRTAWSEIARPPSGGLIRPLPVVGQQVT
jgi:hypothetical protein